MGYGETMAEAIHSALETARKDFGSSVHIDRIDAPYDIHPGKLRLSPLQQRLRTPK